MLVNKSISDLLNLPDQSLLIEFIALAIANFVFLPIKPSTGPAL